MTRFLLRWYTLALLIAGFAAVGFWYHPAPLVPSLTRLWDGLTWVALGLITCTYALKDLSRQWRAGVLTAATSALAASGFGEGNFIVGPGASLLLAWCIFDLGRTFG